MTRTSQGQFRDSIGGTRAASLKDGFKEPPKSFRQKTQDVPELVLRLTNLLQRSPVDLTRIGGEIRAHPDLDALVMRLTGSLALSPERNVSTLEEAAVVLGTHRLRVLVYMWSICSQDLAAAGFKQQGEINSGKDRYGQTGASEASETWTPETLYLATFLRWLGLDSPGAATSRDEPPWLISGLENEEFAALRDMLMRDFIALIPVLNPAVLKSR